MKNSIVLTVASMITLGAAPPCFANDAVNSMASFAGSAAATVVTTPQAMVVDSLWHQPRKAWHGLATAFGDEKGFQQNVAGAVIGIPFGVVWGIPTGFLRGAKHGMGVGWEKPFSTESFLVLKYDDK
jgi:hypothetical protein